jgi:putative membrane protein
MKKYYPHILLAIFTIVWLVLAISPSYRDIWFAENILSILLVLGLILTYKKFKFSNFTYTILFFFLVLHTIGAHYTYAEMPLFNMLKSNLALTRNHYDRIVHFLFGLIFFFPIQEILARKLNIKGARSYLLAFLVVFALKGIYEVVEWLYAIIRESHLVDTFFLGAQGDVWDAQKDMAWGAVGALISWVGLGLARLIHKK